METHSIRKVSIENQMRTVATKENPGSSFRVPCWFFLDPFLVGSKESSDFFKNEISKQWLPIETITFSLLRLSRMLLSATTQPPSLKYPTDE